MYNRSGGRAGNFGADPSFGIASSSASGTTTRYVFMTSSKNIVLTKFSVQNYNRLGWKITFFYYSSLELRRRIRQDSDSEPQRSYNTKSEVVEGSASFLNTSNHSQYTQSSQNLRYEERNNYNYGTLTLACDWLK